MVQWSAVSEARTTTIRRPAGRAASDAGRSRLGDRSRPIAQRGRHAPQRRKALLLGAGAAIIASAIAAAFFVLPVRAWFNQNDNLGQRRQQLRVLERVNAELQSEVDRLQTPDGIREAARDELGFISYGEERLTTSGDILLPTQLPGGWPYDPVSQILRVRSAQMSGITNPVVQPAPADLATAATPVPVEPVATPPAAPPVAGTSVPPSPVAPSVPPPSTDASTPEPAATWPI